MKNYDLELTEDNLLKTIENDYIGRNRKLNKLIEIILAQSKGKVISIDGKWGTGKTIFVKQLQTLNDNDDIASKIKNGSLNEELLKKYRETFIVHYYNAWEKDNHSSPIKSLVFSLLNEYPKYKKKSSKEQNQIPIDIKAFIKNLTMDGYNIDKVESYEDLAEEIITIEEQITSLNKLIDEILPKGKKLLLIVDELDRCKPTYAVELLETIKHLFKNDRIIFIIANNSEQLTHSITNYYGLNFDGYGYLNRFFDLIIELNDVDVKKYLENVCEIDETSYYYNYALYSITEFFSFSMREVNRLLSDFEILHNYFTTTYTFHYQENNILKYIFLPYCLGLKIKSKEWLVSFLKGNGLERVISFAFYNEKMHTILEHEFNQKNKQNEITDDNLREFLTDTYNCYFGNKNVIDIYERERIKEDRDTFLETFSLLGDYIKIESEKQNQS